MLPSKFRHHSGSKPSKSSSAQQASPTFQTKAQQATNTHVMPGSMPGSLSGSSPSTSAYNVNQRKPPSPQINSGNFQGSMRSPQQTSSQTQNLPRQRGGPPSGMKPTLAPPDPRRVIVDHIIRDCYSKSIVIDGKKVPEVKYNTHLLIREYASYPQTAPPADLSPAQIGSVKSRILVVCTKHTGRVLLQKGKYNDQKKVYQIGRTWDLDELVSIAVVANDALILQLNKDYYWKSGDDPGRLHKFVHHLAVIYHRFTGHYPEMKGISPESLGLMNSLPPALASSSPVKSHSSNIESSNSSQASVNHYKDMDFTVNGTLPVKPMQVMDVDRPSNSRTSTPISVGNPLGISQHASIRQSADSFTVKSSQGAASVLSRDTSRESPKQTTDTPVYAFSAETKSINDSQSFIFTGDDTVDEGTKTMPTISEYAQKNGSLSPPKSFKLDHLRSREGSDNLETAARYSMQLESQLENEDSAKEQPTFQFGIPVPSLPAPQTKDDASIEEVETGIEEASLSDSSTENRKYSVSKNMWPEKQSAEKTTSRKDSVIDDSIKEIEDFMATQFGKPAEEQIEPIRSHSRSPSKALSRKLSASSRSQSIARDERVVVPSPEPQTTHAPAATEHSKNAVKTEKDPEIEELLDEMGWNPTDGTDSCVKMLRKELTSIKHKNVLELTTLDFGKDSLANEVKTAAGEIENLVEIFKRMEASFMMVAPQINNIEENSKGLQVEAVNKKVLYNELDEILRKVRLSDRDLSAVANYDQFDEASLVPHLEEKLLLLFDALQAIGSKASDDDLSKMQALKQFNETYEQVSQSFIQNYTSFITGDIKNCIERLNKDAVSVYPESFLPCFRKSLAYTGINVFVKSTTDRAFSVIVDYFNVTVASLLDNVLAARVKTLYSGGNSARNSRLIYNSDTNSGLKKNKSSRFGSTRLLGRFSGVNGEHSSAQKQTEVVPKSSEEVSDSRLIIRLVKESTDFMLVIQFILGSVFNLMSEEDYSTYVSSNTVDERVVRYDAADLEEFNYKTNSNDILRNMSVVFGNYINKFIREVTPADLITIQVLLGLSAILADAEGKNQDFVAYSFVAKLSEKYRANWDRFISHQIDLIDKSEVRAKGGIVPAVRNVNQIITTIETSIQDSHHGQPSSPELNSLIQDTYQSLTKAALKLFDRDDPLLKSNSHDEKEKAYRNVATLQNLYSIMQQLSEYESATTADMKTHLGSAFKTVQEEYFDYVMRMHLGRVSEFVSGHSNNEQASATRNKKEEKILVRGIGSSLTSRDMSSKINDMFHSMQKQVVSSDTVFEHDLFDLMWGNLSAVVEDVLRQFHRIAKSIDKDAEESMSANEIRRQFNEQHRAPR